MPLVLLHGSGGDEDELVPLAADLAPGSPILAVRGGMAFDGGFAFFHRLADRSIDEADIASRAVILADFIRAASTQNRFARAPIRLAWIATLNRGALRGYDRADLSLRLRYAPQAVQQVGELMRQEQACCAFLTFEMYEEPDAVTLTIKAPEEARATVEGLFEAFLPAEGQTVENQPL
jgi:hypothetical protein